MAHEGGGGAFFFFFFELLRRGGGAAASATAATAAPPPPPPPFSDGGGNARRDDVFFFFPRFTGFGGGAALSSAALVPLASKPRSRAANASFRAFSCEAERRDVTVSIASERRACVSGRRGAMGHECVSHIHTTVYYEREREGKPGGS